MYALVAKREWKLHMAGYWPRSFSFASLWAEAESRSIKTNKSVIDQRGLVNNNFSFMAKRTSKNTNFFYRFKAEQSRAGKMALSCPLV